MIKTKFIYFIYFIYINMNGFNTIYSALLIVSTILFVISFTPGFTGDAYMGITIAAYASLLLSIFMMLFLIINKSIINNIPMLTSLLSSGPIFILLCIIGFVFYLLIFYYNKIIENHVSYDYYIYSGISTFFILLQSLLLYYNINPVNGLIPLTYMNIFIALCIFSLSSSIITYIILSKYTTDGFINNNK
jgi:hypothetical protein